MNVSDSMADLITQKAQELFKICDQEEKGFICKRDMQRMLGEISLEPDQLETVFDSLDVDANGFLTLEEFASGFGRFLGMSDVENGEGSKDSSDNKMEEKCEGEHTPNVPDPQDEEDEYLEFLVASGATDLLQENDETVRQIWQSLRGEGLAALQTFSSLLRETAKKLQQANHEQKSLEAVVKQQQDTLNTQMQYLSEEMEAQLSAEKCKAKQKLDEQEQKVKEEMEVQLAMKDFELQMLQKKYSETVSELGTLTSADTERRSHMTELEKQKESLERQLAHQSVLIDELKSNVDHSRAAVMDERKRRAQAAFSVTEDIAQERQDLVRQLDMLKTLNTKLLDEKDTYSTHSRTSSPLGVARKDMTDVSDREIALLEYDCEVDDEYAQILQRNQSPVRETFSPVPSSPAHLASSGAHKGPLPLQATTNCLLEELTAASGNRVLSAEVNSSSTNITNSMSPPMFTQSGGDSETFSQFAAPSITCCQNSGTKSADSMSSDHYSVTSLPPQHVYKVIVIGDAGVGKSCLVQRICNKEVDFHYATTIGVDFRVHTMTLDGKIVSIQLWDTAGQERYRSITKQYFRKADGVFVIFDVTSENSFKHCRQWIECVMEVAAEDVSTVLVGNKVDLCPDSSGRVISSKTAQQLADRYSALYAECSAVSSKGVLEAVELMGRLLMKREIDQLENAIKLVGAGSDRKPCCK